MLVKLHINISFAKALKRIPIYAKFIKDLLTRKINLLDDENVALNK